MKCKICDKECISISNHLKIHNITSKEYYDKHLKKSTEGVCANKICSEKTSFKGMVEGYAKYCSIKCASNDDIIKQKRENSLIKKYGVTNISFHRDTVIKRSEQLRNKSELEKIEINEKKKETSLKNYNTTHPMKNKIIIEKTQETNLKKYGNICSAQGKDIQEKIKETFIKKYNTYHPMKNIEVKQKLKKTITEKRKKIIEDFIFENYNLQILNQFENNYTSLHLKCLKCNNEFFQTYFNIYQGPHPCIICYPRNTSISKQEIELQDFLISINVKFEKNYRKLIINKETNRFLEIDIFIPDKNIAIEFNGLYWHSEERVIRKDIHLYKLNLCKNLGIKLIHIFEDEWIFKRNIVKKRLETILYANKKNKLSARDKLISIKEIDVTPKNIFLEKYHLQGSDHSVIKLGAFYKDQLISVMTFSKGNISKGSVAEEGVWELNRFCSDYNFHVVGIAGKLLSHFKKNYEWKKIFSYADRRWSDGNLYYKLGFVLERETPINYWYLKNGQRIHRFNLRKRPEEPKDIPEWVLRQAEGYTRIWDCGNLKFVMENS